MSNIANYRINSEETVPSLFIDVYFNNILSVSTEINVFSDNISSIPQNILIDFSNALQNKIDQYMSMSDRLSINRVIDAVINRKQIVDMFILERNNNV